MPRVAVRNKIWFIPWMGHFLTATGAPVASQGTLDVSFQLVDLHGVDISVSATCSNCFSFAVQS